MDLVHELIERGLIEHHSADPALILSKGRTVYFGSDPTADSLHVGHLVGVLLMKRLADAGNKPILLVGGGTGMIGDPKEKGERSMIDMKTVDANKKALRLQLQKIIGKSMRTVDNADWLLKVQLIPFLRDIGKHFTVNDLIKRDLIKKRLDTPDESISYTEFTYSLLQAYDYMMLNQKYGCDLQIGGSDQWTNILSGVELVRKKEGKEVFALTFPLINDASGKKFGKSEGNAVWLDANKTSPFAFYQFWLQTDDRNIDHYLKVFTFVSLPEIAAMVEMHGRSPERRQGQRMLAKAVTEVVHGKDAALHAEKCTDVLFGTTAFSSLTKAEQTLLMKSVPSVSVTSTKIEAGYTVVDVLIDSGLLTSKSEARRLLEGGGVRLNGEVASITTRVTTEDFINGLAIVQKGKSEKVLVSLA
ncbi:tyrosine--tRNA ligase [Patescibacteria group bacterium]|nr:tyrosine--tRNA ligase [Patescibacteria group bacterium]MBU1755082.1 tyrosine--tRNA ligase [Patescibacteria group bacterium]